MYLEVGLSRERFMGLVVVTGKYDYEITQSLRCVPGIIRYKVLLAIRIHKVSLQHLVVMNKQPDLKHLKLLDLVV